MTEKAKYNFKLLLVLSLLLILFFSFNLVSALFWSGGSSSTSSNSTNSDFLDGYDSSFFQPLNTSVRTNVDYNGGWLLGGLSIIGGNIYVQTINISNQINLQANSPLKAPPVGNLTIYAQLNNGNTRPVYIDDDGINVTIARDNFYIVRNTGGDIIRKGQAMYITGSTGNVPNVALAIANQSATMPSISIAMQDIANNNFGYGQFTGVLSGIDTSGFSSGDQLYLSTTALGNFTNVRPTTPNLVERVGSVLVSGVGNGAIAVIIAPFIGGLETGTTATYYRFSGTINVSDDIYFNNGSKVSLFIVNDSQVNLSTLNVTGVFKTNKLWSNATAVGIGIFNTTANLTLEIKGSTQGNPGNAGTQSRGIFRIGGPTNNVLDIGTQSVSPFGIWFQVTDRSNLASTYPLLLQPNAGNVGIGTLSPSNALDVFGSQNLGKNATTERLISGTPSGVSRVFNLIDDQAAIRVTRTQASGNAPDIEMIWEGSLNQSVGNETNTWYDIYVLPNTGLVFRDRSLNLNTNILSLSNRTLGNAVGIGIVVPNGKLAVNTSFNNGIVLTQGNATNTYSANVSIGDGIFQNQLSLDTTTHTATTADIEFNLLNFTCSNTRNTFYVNGTINSVASAGDSFSILIARGTGSNTSIQGGLYQKLDGSDVGPGIGCAPSDTLASGTDKSFACKIATEGGCKLGETLSINSKSSVTPNGPLSIKNVRIASN